MCVCTVFIAVKYLRLMKINKKRNKTSTVTASPVHYIAINDIYVMLISLYDV